MIQLHEHPFSPYARKVKLALLEKGLPFERVRVTMEGWDSPAYGALNPRQEVPALVDGDACVFDSTVICEYLDERYPDVPLYPRDPADRARVRILEDVADTKLEASVWGLFELRFFDRATPALAEKMIASGTAALQRQLDWLETQLAGRSFFGGETFGIADCALVPHLGGAAMFGIKAGPSRPSLAAWVQRIRERASVREDVAQVKEVMEQVMTQGARATFPRPRQYRDHRLEWMVRHGGVEIVTAGLANGTIRLSRDL